MNRKDKIPRGDNDFSLEDSSLTDFSDFSDCTRKLEECSRNLLRLCQLSGECFDVDPEDIERAADEIVRREEEEARSYTRELLNRRRLQNVHSEAAPRSVLADEDIGDWLESERSIQGRETGERRKNDRNKEMLESKHGRTDFDNRPRSHIYSNPCTSTSLGTRKNNAHVPAGSGYGNDSPELIAINIGSNECFSCVKTKAKSKPSGEEADFADEKIKDYSEQKTVSVFSRMTQTTFQDELDLESQHEKDDKHSQNEITRKDQCTCAPVQRSTASSYKGYRSGPGSNNASQGVSPRQPLIPRTAPQSAEPSYRPSLHYSAESGYNQYSPINQRFYRSQGCENPNNREQATNDHLNLGGGKTWFGTGVAAPRFFSVTPSKIETHLGRKPYLSRICTPNNTSRQNISPMPYPASVFNTGFLNSPPGYPPHQSVWNRQRKPVSMASYRAHQQFENVTYRNHQVPKQKNQRLPTHQLPPLISQPTTTNQTQKPHNSCVKIDSSVLLAVAKTAIELSLKQKEQRDSTGYSNLLGRGLDQ